MYRCFLLLRPTDRKPGIYPIDDPVLLSEIVIKYRGESHVMIWCDKAGAEKISKSGDIVFSGVHLK